MADQPATTGSKLEKAYLTITPVAADGSAAGSPTTLALRFNPTEYRVTKSADWERTPAPGSVTTGMLQWKGAGPRTLTLTAFLDVSDAPSGDVLADVETLLACCVPTADSVARLEPSPPLVTFGWGTTTSFPAVMRQVDAAYTLFRADGSPCRAKVSLTLEEVPSAPARQNPTSGAEAVTRTHTVSVGDRLPLIAYRMYGDAALWRLIADANDVDDPLVLPAGVTLLVPARGRAG